MALDAFDGDVAVHLRIEPETNDTPALRHDKLVYRLYDAVGKMSIVVVHHVIVKHQNPVVLGWHEQMRSRTPYPVRLVNIAVSGLTIAQLNTVWINMSAFPCTGSFSKVILVGPNSAAGNSINNGETGAQAFADLQTYLTTVKSKCTWSAIIVATLPTGGATSGPNFDYNTLVRANAVSLGYIVADWAADPVMGPNSNLNPVLYKQVNPYGLHPTVAGHSYLATDMLGPLRAAIGQ